MSPNETIAAQRQVECSAADVYRDQPSSLLRREQHVEYLAQIFTRALPKSFACLNAGRPWVCYWVCHGLYLLDAIDGIDATAMTSFLASCQHETGGFGGGPGQLPHLATTYAAVSALVTLGTDEALAVIDRQKMLEFFLRQCRSSEQGGGMTMHDGGEVDVRGCYCALCACYVLGLDGRQVVEACDMGRFVRACQGHEGGIGGEPGNEGHGGYGFCAYGALALAESCGWLSNATRMIDRSLLVSWVTRMQGHVEGGMRGRTNKLVDGCYSWWCGGLCRLLANGGVGVGGKEVIVESVENAENVEKGDRARPRKGNTRLANAVQAWCDNQSNQRNVLLALESELDETMEQYVATEERIQQRDIQSGADQLSLTDVEEVKRLGEDAVQLQNEIEELEEHIRCVEDSTACLRRLLMAVDGSNKNDNPKQLIDMSALQMWALLACQVPGKGGLRDKPGTHQDFYHTCYVLSGISAAQEVSGTVGGAANRLRPAHPIVNVGIDRIERSIAFFARA